MRRALRWMSGGCVRPVAKKSGVLVIMLMALFSKLGLAESVETAPLKPRQIVLSKAVVDFSIPENFSKQMPADDMIDQVNLDDAALFADPERFTLLRRWWDFKPEHFWQSSPGTLMMSVLVQEKAQGSEYDLLDRQQFVRLLQQRLIDVHGTDTFQYEDAPTRVYLPFVDDYQEMVFKGQRWIMHPLGGITERESYYIPLTQTQFLLVDFTFMKSTLVSDDAYYPKAKHQIERIMSSFHVSYPQGSLVGKAVEDPDLLSFDEVKKALKQQ